MHDHEIIHRDLHMKNVMLQFKDLAPSKDEMDSPLGFYEHILPNKLKEAVKNLDNPDAFEIKIIDYGLSREFQ